MHAKVRHELLRLAREVPDDAALLALETIAFTAGQCVGYHESLESGAGGDGAYVCQLSITAPAFERPATFPHFAAPALETHYQRGVCLKIKPASLLPLLPWPDWPGCRRSLRAGYI